MSDKRRPGHDSSPRTGSVVAEDDDLTTWLHSLWHRGEPPERLEVWQVFDRNKSTRGEMIFHVDFKPNTNYNAEQALKLANEIIKTAQNDTDCVERKSNYQIAVIDIHRKASPLIRRLGPLYPKRTYLNGVNTKSGMRDEDDDDEEGQPLLRSKIELEHIRSAHDHIRWEQKRNDLAIGGVINLLEAIVTKQQEYVGDSLQKIMDIHEKWQDSEDRKIDREIARAKANLWVEGLKEGMRLVRNVLPGVIAPDAGPNPNQIPAGSGQPKAQITDFGLSKERALIDNILYDCKNTGIDVKLFGEWELDENDNPIKLKTPGVFTPQQLKIFLGIQQGKLHADEVDALMLNSGHPCSIKPDQLAQAMAIMPDSIKIAVMELIKVREEKHIAAVQAAESNQK